MKISKVTSLLLFTAVFLFAFSDSVTFAQKRSKEKTSKARRPIRKVLLPEVLNPFKDGWQGDGTRRWFNGFGENNFSLEVELGTKESVVGGRFYWSPSDEPQQIEEFTLRLKPDGTCSFRGVSTERWFIRDENGKATTEDFKLTSEAEGYRPSADARKLFKETLEKLKLREPHDKVTERAVKCLPE